MPGETSKMGVYKLKFPGETAPTGKFSPFRQSSVARRFIPSYANGRVQPVAKASSLESPETATDEDDATSVFTASTRTSDDDVSLTDSTSDFLPARHSTACCTDVALRRELRRKFHVEPARAHSFRRELLDHEDDRVESLALWEESVDPPCESRSISKHLPWHGDLASSTSSRNRGLESLFRKPRKPSSSLSFFTGFFSGLPFSRSRKS